MRKEDLTWCCAMRQRDIMLHMGRVDATMVSKIHCTLKKQVAPPGTWARCVVRL